MARRSTAAPWSLTKTDMREAARCKADDCKHEATTRTRDDDGHIRRLCTQCAAARLDIAADELEKANGQWTGGRTA